MENLPPVQNPTPVMSMPSAFESAPGKTFKKPHPTAFMLGGLAIFIVLITILYFWGESIAKAEPSAPITEVGQ